MKKQTPAGAPTITQDDDDGVVTYYEADEYQPEVRPLQTDLIATDIDATGICKSPSYKGTSLENGWYCSYDDQIKCQGCLNIKPYCWMEIDQRPQGVGAYMPFSEDR